MREIKFRAWDKIAKRMTLLSVEYDSDVGGFYIEGNYISRSHSDLMQYTGLKDKNGVEIFEGDILASGTGKFARAFEVAWEDDHLAMDRMDDEYSTGCGFNIGKSETKYIEIIGNIYENKELLK